MVPTVRLANIPTVNRFQRHGYELVEDQRPARLTAVDVCCVEELGEERRAEVFEVVRASSQHRSVGLDGVAAAHVSATASRVSATR